MFFFLDIETTGLDPRRDNLLEVACVAVDRDLRVVDQVTYVTGAWYTTPGQFDRDCNDFVQDVHTKNGLKADVIASTLTMHVASVRIAEFVKKFDQERNVLAGSSIHFDRRFMRTQLTESEELFHHRMLDVSSVRIMVENAFPDLPEYESGDVAHRALPDALDSLERYKHYVNVLGWGSK